MRAALVSIALVVAGCAKPHDLMPLEVHKSWTYEVSYGLTTKIEPLKVTRKISVAGVEGYEIGGNVGLSRMAWADGTLLLDSGANARFYPAVPILTTRGTKMSWTGECEAMGLRQPATANLAQENDTISYKGRNLPTTRTTLTVKLPTAELEIQTWFHEGTGILRQEQRTRRRGEPRGELIVQLELFAGA